MRSVARRADDPFSEEGPQAFGEKQHSGMTNGKPVSEIVQA
jgi:hypothetical protein